MTTRLPSLHGRLTTFASGPWESTPDEGVLDVMAATVRGPVDGLAVTARLTRDGVAVLADSDRVGKGFRKRRINEIDATELPPDVTPLAAVLGRTAGRNPLLVTVSGDAAFETVLATAREFGEAAEKSLWLIGHEHAELVRWRPRTEAILLHGSARRRAGGGVEKLLAALHGDDIDGVSMPHGDWSGGSVALAHRFGLLTHASGAHHSRELAVVIDAGIDAVTADEPMRLAAAAAQYYP